MPGPAFAQSAGHGSPSRQAPTTSPSSRITEAIATSIAAGSGSATLSIRGSGSPPRPIAAAAVQIACDHTASASLSGASPRAWAGAGCVTRASAAWPRRITASPSARCRPLSLDSDCGRTWTSAQTPGTAANTTPVRAMRCQRSQSSHILSEGSNPPASTICRRRVIALWIANGHPRAAAAKGDASTRAGCGVHQGWPSRKRRQPPCSKPASGVVSAAFNIRSRWSGASTSSASRKMIHSPDAAAMPLLRAAPAPPLSCRISRKRASASAKPWAIAAVSSRDPSSTMIASQPSWLWASTLRRVRSRVPALL